VDGRRIIAIDALRGAAALVVLVWHYPFYFHEKVFPALLAPAYSNGAILVDVFFVISGFVLAHVYSDRLATFRQLGVYALTRLRRLYPLHLATLLVTVVLFAELYVRTGQFGYCYPIVNNDWRHFLLHLALIQEIGLQSGLAFNAPSWSICTELWVGLLFGLALVALPRRMLTTFALIMAIAATAVRVRFWGPVQLAPRDLVLPRTVVGFFLGVVTQRLWCLRKRWSSSWAGVCLALGGGLVLWATLSPPPSAWSETTTLIWSPIGGALLVWGAATSRWAARLASARWVTWLADISFSVYLWHFPVAVIFKLTGLTPRVAGEDGFVLYLAATLTVSTLSLRFLERPSNRLFQSTFQRWWSPRERLA
jgi:peptidoglycan/LPS O-acetylase OafA/YrhL